MSDLRATLTVETGQHAGKTVVLDGRPVGIGRSSKCALSLKGAPGVSRDHALLMVKDGQWVVSDAGSRNGTLLNGAEVQGSALLQDGDVIGISEERIRFAWPARAGQRSSSTKGREAPASVSMPQMPRASIPPLPGTTPPMPIPSVPMPAAPARTREVPRTTRTIDDRSSPARPAPQTPFVPTVPFVDPNLSLPEPPPMTGPPPTQPSSSGARAPSPDESGARRAATMPPTLPPRKKSSIGTFVMGGLAGLFLAVVGGLAFDHVMDGGTRRAAAIEWAMATYADVKSRHIDPLLAGKDAPPSVDGVARADAGVVDDDAGVDSGPKVDAGTRARKDAGVAAPPVARVDAGTAPVVDKPPPVFVKVEIKAPLTGRVSAVRVKPGETITVGTTVAILESGNARTMRKLVPLDKKAQALRESAAKGKKSAAKELRSVENSIAKLTKRLKKTTVKASVEGVVETVQVEEGTHLKGKDALVTVKTTKK